MAGCRVCASEHLLPGVEKGKAAGVGELCRGVGGTPEIRPDYCSKTNAKRRSSPSELSLSTVVLSI